MISRRLKSGDSYGVSTSTNEGKILIQITALQEQARGLFTKEEARDLIKEIEKQLST